MYLFVALSGLLRKAIGLSFCINTAPRPTSDASVSTMNYWLMPASARIGVDAMAILSLSNAT
jgi:hypothetical protein